ncbi:thyrotropin-releasing hormone receptor-like [Mytilus edulis]|uniref:thyrotropin-releasing hormone receptor-like n=1 Tax=Mytilus edulis TaxID=6550 RepID=UPI0039F08314
MTSNRPNVNYGNESMFKQEHTCNQSEIYIPAAWIHLTYVCLAIETSVVNIFVMVVFTRPRNRTPSTVLLSLLAASDSVTSILSALPTFVGFVFYSKDLESTGDLFDGSAWLEHYPGCIVWMCVTNISLAFHLISVTITVVLSIQKVIALRHPLWSLQRLQKKKSNVLIICLFSFLLISVFVWISFIDTKSFYNGENDVCCYDDYLDADDIDVLNTGMNIFLLSAVFIIMFSTVYLCCKLWKSTTNVQRTRNIAAIEKAHRSARIVVMISIVFILSELLNILITINDSRLFPYVKFIEMLCDSYCLLSRQIGFSLNFLVYLIMSENLRNTLLAALTGACKFQRRKKSKSTVRTVYTISNGCYTMSTRM